MLFVDGINIQTINTSNSSSDKYTKIALRVKNQFEQIKREKRLVIFRVPDRNPVNDSGMIEPPKTVTIPNNVTYFGQDGTEEWVYTNQGNFKSASESSDNYIFIVGEKTLNPKTEFELIYFLRYISPAVSKGYIVEYDEEKESARFFSETSKEEQLKIIMSTLTDYDQIKKLAQSWGVENSERYDLNVLKYQLYNRVLHCEANIVHIKRGIEDFIEDIKYNNESLITRSLIQDALDKKLIIKDHISGAYHYTAQDGTLGLLLFKPYVGDLIKGVDALFGYVNENPNELANIKNLLEGKSIEDKVWTIAEIDKLSWREFKKYCPIKDKNDRDQLRNEWIKKDGLQ